jgi:hypothetical protein
MVVLGNEDAGPFRPSFFGRADFLESDERAAPMLASPNDAAG